MCCKLCWVFFVRLRMKKESLTAWTSVDLDNILCCGDYLYKEIYKLAVYKVIIYTHQIYHAICSVKMLFLDIRLCHCVVVCCIQVLRGVYHFSLSKMFLQENAILILSLVLLLLEMQLVCILMAMCFIHLMILMHVMNMVWVIQLVNVFFAIFLTLLTCVLTYEFFVHQHVVPHMIYCNMTCTKQCFQQWKGFGVTDINPIT